MDLKFSSSVTELVLASTCPIARIVKEGLYINLCNSTGISLLSYSYGVFSIGCDNTVRLDKPAVVLMIARFPDRVIIMRRIVDPNLLFILMKEHNSVEVRDTCYGILT